MKREPETYQTQQQPLSSFRIAIYVISLAPFFLFSGVEAALGETLRQAWQLGGLVLFFFVLIQDGVLVFDPCNVYFALYQIEVFLITTIKSEFRPGILITVIANILIAFLIRNDRMNFLYAISYVMVTALFLNTVTMVLQGTGGFHKSYFIGGKNALSIMLVPGIFILYLLQEELSLMARTNKYGRYMEESARRQRMLFYMFSTVSIASMLYGKSGTGTVMSIVTLITLLFINRIKINKRFILAAILAVNGIILFGDVVFTSELWISFTSMLGKDPTLTYRTEVWAGAMQIFKRSIFFGQGRIFRIFYQDEYGLSYSVRETHNFVLQILCEGGLIGLLLYTKAFVASIGSLDTNNKLQKTVFIAFALILFNGFTETVNNKLFTIIVPAIANSYLIDNIRTPQYRSIEDTQGNFHRKADFRI